MSAVLAALLILPLGARGAALNPVAPAVAAKAQPFEMPEVRLLEGPFREVMLRDKAYLFKLDSDRLLHSFRLTAGLPTSAQPYGGWEAPNGELRGHSMGHYLSACALMYASTGDEALKAKADAIVVELAKCQAALPGQGYHRGFLSAYPEEFFDRVDACKRVWAPYYTLHKIMAGLLDMYQHCGNRQALDILSGMADWLKLRVDRLSTEQMQKALQNEHGGMNEVFANLYAVTGNPDHLRMAKAFNHAVIFAPLARGEDKLDGLHANTQIPKIIGAAREYELTGEKEFREIAVNFWENVALKRSYCIGGHSEGEHFFPVATFSKHLGPTTAETCNTYNVLKLTRHLFEWEPSAKVMDFYERALFNQILGSQDPETGMLIYFASLKPGHFKDYSTPDNSFWCCVGTGMENHAKYCDTIYSHVGDSLYVNLFIASELTWKEKGVVVRQETRFPESDTTRLTLKCGKPTKLAVKIRRAAWASNGMNAVVNGKRIEAEGAPGSYVTIEREWKDGDTLEIQFPMVPRLEAMPDDPSVVAVLYGPITLAGELGAEGLEKIAPYSKGQLDHVRVPVPNIPVLVCDAKDLLGHLKPVAGQQATFRTQGIGKPADVTLIPYYRLHHQRLAVYWKLLTEDEWKSKQAAMAEIAAKRKAFEARIMDEVNPGEQQQETDHAFNGEKTNFGDFQDRKWRDASGWFSYEVKVVPDQPATLRCTYWGSDINRDFEILVDGEKIASQTLNKNKPGEFYEEEYAVPQKLTQGKQRITVKFQARTHSVAGGLFGLLVLKPQTP